MNESQPQTPVYQVVVNHEEQYSIWPAGRELPDGWSAEGTTGPKEVCLTRIEDVWVDMRPLSLRRRMADAS
ncbi:MbtH family NRPS accessory protein [Streptomyces sp. TRM66268-LWL]|uniref:MbtH family NRPS accessory protein n=1 Tax=Streptomyces polyasparticus TaxID=2767826 RepID=A0ABR7SVK6_9ACTN|nr:MbtH family NRPS accessory protein [Streptomyces polyasparticus]MBC9718904.1 MbtH family NRPS accessory protein [Streptomyces polyasparticus]